MEKIVTRPPSIVAFERLYLGSILLGIVNAIAFWSINRAAILDLPQVQASTGMTGMVDGMLIGSLAINVAISLLFWWLVARQGSVVGKWLVVVTEAIGLVMAILPLLRLLRGTAGNVPGTVLALVSTALAVAAAAMLFRADANGWFAARDAEPAA